jgi:hypothetical protein
LFWNGQGDSDAQVRNYPAYYAIEAEGFVEREVRREVVADAGSVGHFDEQSAAAYVGHRSPQLSRLPQNFRFHLELIARKFAAQAAG